jgi:hypothetical protein
MPRYTVTSSPCFLIPVPWFSSVALVCCVFIL